MVIIAILLLSLVLRLVNLNQSLWLDESVQAIVSQGSLGSLLANLRGDFHPPLYHFFMWFWVRIFGINEMVLRMPSVIFGVLAVYGVYLISNKLFEKEKKYLSYFAAILFATAPFHIYYSQEARMYSLVTFTAVFSMFFFINLLDGKTKNKFFYVLFTSLMIFSDYFGFLVLGAQVLYLLFKRKFNYLKYPFLATIPFIFWLPYFFVQLKIGREAVNLIPKWGELVNLNVFKALPLTFIKFTIGRITIFNKILYAVLSGTLFVVYGSILLKFIIKLKSFKEKSSFEIIFIWLFFPIAAALAGSFFVPNYQPFRLLLVLPAFYLLLVGSLKIFKSRLMVYLFFSFFLTVNLVSLSRYYLNPYFHREDWRSTVKFLKMESTVDSIVLIPSNSSHFPLTYYADNNLEFYGITGVSEVNENDLLNLSNKIGNKKTIYFINYLSPVFDPSGEIPDYLKNVGYNKIQVLSFNQLEIWVYLLESKNK